MLPLRIATALAVLLAATPAAASNLRLDWRAPEGCPSEDNVRAAALRSAGPGTQPDAALEAEAVVSRTANASWRVHLTTKRGAAIGERDLEAATCRGVADATAAILGLALVPAVVSSLDDVDITQGKVAAADITQGKVAAAAPEPVVPFTPRAEPERVRPRASVGDAKGPPVLAAGLSGAAQAATLPSAAVGGAMTVAWTPGRARIEASASIWSAQSQTTTSSEMGARFAMTAIGGSACWALVKSAVELGPCAGGEVAFVGAEGFGAKENRSANARWASASGSVLAGIPLGSMISIRARLDALVPLSRPTFVVENEGTVHRPPTLGVRGSVGLEIHFL